MVLSVPRVAGLEAILTPALVVDLDAVRQNIAATLRLLGEDPNRWRPHLKTAKLGLIMRTIREHGVAQAKCSTTLELETACEAGFRDLLLAYPVTGPQVDVVKRIAAAWPATSISVLVEDAAMVAPAVISQKAGLVISSRIASLSSARSFFTVPGGSV